MKNNNNATSYFLFRSLFLGFGMSSIFSLGKADTYIAAILGTLLGILIIFIYSKCFDKYNQFLKEYFKSHHVLNFCFKSLYFIYIIFYIFILLVSISTFIYSFFLPFTPTLMSCLPFIFIASFLNTKNYKNISAIAFILFIISIVIVILKTLLVSSGFDFSNLLPILATNKFGIIKCTLLYTILSTTPALCLVGENVDFKNNLKYYLLSNLTIIIVLISITLTFGTITSIYSYPEYAILKKIRFFKFIENIENVISITWFFDIFISLSISSLKIKEIFNSQKSYVPLIIVSLIMIFVNYFISDNFFNTMIIYKIAPVIIGILTLAIVIFILLIPTKKRQV